MPDTVQLPRSTLHEQTLATLSSQVQARAVYPVALCRGGAGSGRLLAGFGAVWRRLDAVVTPTAPAFGAWRAEAAWRKALVTVPFNVFAAPALSVYMGFARRLPLGLQVAGWPFDDVTAVRVGHAYEGAIPWRAIRPPLRPGSVPPQLLPARDSELVLDDAERAAAADAVRRAGPTLTARQFDLVRVVAPHVAAILARLRRPRRFGEEPANVFCVS